MEEWYKKTTAVEPNQYCEIATECLICGESVPVYSIHDAPKICNKCREAVLELREKKQILQ